MIMKISCFAKADAPLSRPGFRVPPVWCRLLHRSAYYALLACLATIGHVAQAQHGPDATATILLPEHLRKSPGAPLTLGDVAELSSKQLALLQRLMGVPLPRQVPGAAATALTPAPMRHQGVEHLDRRSLEQAIRNDVLLARVKLQWLGAQSVEIVSTVTPARPMAVRQLRRLDERMTSDNAGQPRVWQTVRSDMLVSVALRSLQQQCGQHGACSAIEVLSAPEDLFLDNGKLALFVRPLASRLAQRTTVWIDARLDGRTVRSIPLVFAIDKEFAPAARAPVHAAAHKHTGAAQAPHADMAMHGVFSADDPSDSSKPASPAMRTVLPGSAHGPVPLVPASVTVSDSSSPSAPDPVPAPLAVAASASASPTAAARPASAADSTSDQAGVAISAPVPLCSAIPAAATGRPAATLPTPAVRRGEQAVLAVETSAINLASRVEVLQNGCTGDTVSVRRTGARQPIRALVMGPGQVPVAP